eukprot:SAG25_NODE_3623_length_1019_cov_1.270652_3_plen_86_part_00
MMIAVGAVPPFRKPSTASAALGWLAKSVTLSSTVHAEAEEGCSVQVNACNVRPVESASGAGAAAVKRQLGRSSLEARPPYTKQKG